MKNFYICDGWNVRYKRVTKATARRLFNAGEPVTLCPVNLRPFGPFHPGSECTRLFDGELVDFDRLCAEFTFYNCTNAETGRYIAFYVRATATEGGIV